MISTTKYINYSNNGACHPAVTDGASFLRALKIWMLYKSHIFQCMGKIFCVDLKGNFEFNTKYLTHALKDVDFIHMWKSKSS